eukprot:m.263977 g.263977  ORF g.263977 m.263977 type:complete len:100 (+) comp40462_c1_seq3:611-910(+)
MIYWGTYPARVVCVCTSTTFVGAVNGKYPLLGDPAAFQEREMIIAIITMGVTTIKVDPPQEGVLIIDVNRGEKARLHRRHNVLVAEGAVVGAGRRLMLQ